MFKRQPKPETTPVLRAPKPLLFRRRASIVALDLEGDLLVAVQASGSRITRVAAGPVEWPEKKGDPAADGAALKKALESLRLRPKEVLLAAPRGQVVFRPLQVPMASDLRELAAIVNFQIAKDLPFRVEDAVIDFKVVRTVEGVVPETENGEKGGKTTNLEVLVGAVRLDLIKYYQALTKAAGVKLAGVGLRSAGLAQGLAFAEDSSAQECVMAVSIRPEETTVDVVCQGKLVFSRVAALPAFPAASERESESEQKWLQSLGVEVVRSLHSYEGSPNQQPVKAVRLIGSTGFEKAVADLLAGRLSLPAAVVALDKFPDSEAASKAAAAVVTAAGLAHGFLQPAGLSLDFANPKKPVPANSGQTIKRLGLAVGLLAVVITLFCVRANLIKKRLALKQAAQAELIAEEKKLPIYRRLKSQTKVVSAWMGDNSNWLDHLAYLSAILPPADQLYVSAWTTTPQHVIRISVQAKSGELLSALDKKLRSAGYEVKPLSITPANDKHGYNFRTTVELSVPKKMKPNWTELKPPPRPADDSRTAAAGAKPKGQS